MKVVYGACKEPLINKPPLLNTVYNRHPHIKIKALKRRGLLITDLHFK